MKNNTSLKWLGYSFLITLIKLALSYFLFGSFFEESEIITAFTFKTNISDPSIPINYNAHTLVISELIKLQKQLPNIPIFGVYCFSLLFIAIWVVNYYLLRKNTSLTNKMALTSIFFLLFIDSLTHIHNSRISILLLIAFSIMIYYSSSKIERWISLGVFTLACITRVEYGFIYTGILLTYYILIRPHSIQLKHIGLVAFISTSFFALLTYEIAQSDPYAKSIFLLEREYYDSNNLISFEGDTEKKKNQLLREALMYYVEDRDIIKPQDYLLQIKKKSPIDYLQDFSWIEDYRQNLTSFKDEITSSLLYVYLVILLALILLASQLSFKRTTFYLLLIALPFVIMLKAEMGARFFAPYFSGLIILFLLTQKNFLNSKKWIGLIVLSFSLYIPILKDHTNELRKYHIQTNKFETLYTYLDKIILDEKKIIHTNFAADYFMHPDIFYNKEIHDQSFMSVAFWHYYYSFRTKKENTFTDPTCILSNIENVIQNPDMELVSFSEFMDFLQDYLFTFHNTELEYKEKKHLIDNLYTYSLEIYEN